MKVTLLGIVLLCGACQSTDSAAVRSIHPVPTTSPSATAPATERPVLPRRLHLDRAEFAVRAWVRDRS